MNISNIFKILLGIGIFLVIVGLLGLLLQKIGLFHLKGDIVIKRDNFTFYFPIVSFIILSIILTILLNIIFRIFRK